MVSYDVDIIVKAEGVYYHAEYGEPREVVVSIHPVWNNFIFFEVTPASFHQLYDLPSITTCAERVGFVMS